MKNIVKTLALMAVVALSGSAKAQGWDAEKYPDYRTGSWNPDPRSVAFAEQFTEAERTGLCPEMRLKRDAARRAKRKAEGEGSVRPDHIDNGATRYFAPVFNQSGGSCGSASRIGYMFTHEINAFRDLDGSNPENYYSTHFVWLHTYGQSGKDEFVEYVGVPNAKTYGGQTYSNLFGYNDESDPDFGWMNGYDKWYSGFRNRMLKPTSNAYSLATEVGREWAKNWLWNHCGDTDFKAGGLIGLGVASGGVWHPIPKTAANDKAGVTGMYYVKEWGVSVDHALTMVGYDDRIEFDLDGNGVYGEVDKDEVGAWIIVNSWGQWCNGGFIYCPYAFAGATFNNDGAAGKRSFNQNSWWYGELYHVRKNYEPKRTIKVKMDYSHRSELCLSVGVSDDLNATKPDKQMNLHHFIWAGDGNYGNGIKEQTGTSSEGKPIYKDTYYAPEVPMLGKWADGKMHDEPMEFGYDLTDLCADYDQSKPLKLFFMIDSSTKNGKKYAQGKGHIYTLSTLDYSKDEKGVETVFDLGETGVADIPCGQQLTWTTVIYGNQLYAPQNLLMSADKITWQTPQKSGRQIEGYKVYLDGTLLGSTKATEYSLQGDGTYGVTAVYQGGQESSAQTICTPIRKQEKNVCIDLSQGNGFTIPEVFATKYPKATMEFWIRPKSLSNYNNAAGGWGTFMFHCNNGGVFTAGWNTTANDRVNSGTALKNNQWNHVAMTVNNKTFTIFVNGSSSGSTTSSNYSGLGGFGNLTFHNGDTKYQDCAYDEIRIWSTNHIASLINNEKDVEISGDIIPDGLLAYYKGDVIYIDGWPYLRDCVGGHHARLTTDDKSTYAEIASDKTFKDVVTSGTFSKTYVKITAPSEPIYAGVPATFSAVCPDATAKLGWTCEAAGLDGYKAKEVAMTFTTPGTYEVSFYAANADESKSFTAVETVEVLPLPAPNAEFALSTEHVAAGQNVSLAPVNPMPAYIYEWSTPGAQTEKSGDMVTAVNYNQKGTYTITLTVKDINGNTTSSSKLVTVEEVAPEAAFVVTAPVIMKGENTVLENVSKYNPTTTQWILQGTGGNVIINGGTTQFTPEHPGVFDITLKAFNEAGQGVTRQERALVVLNADSKNGLSFGTGARVTTTTVPLPADQTAYTFEWWMAPTKLSGSCLGIGDNDSNFQIRVTNGAKMSISNKGKAATSPENFVIAGQWHHYAVTVSTSTVTFYRDGEKIGTGTTTSKFSGDLKNFSIGTSAADMNGSIDEFRVWNIKLTADQIKEYSNAPLQNPREMENLVLYYDFNQNGGDVQDRSASGNTGVRSGFGPDGDAWGLSKGVFSLNYETQGAVDVTTKYFPTGSYKRSFGKTTTIVNGTTPSRFYQIKTWTLENQTVEKKTVATKDAAGNEKNVEMEITTGVHVDTQKNNDFTCTTGWDSFGSLTNHKAFQTFELEPGLYNLSVTFGQHGAAGSSYLVAAEGTTLPIDEELESALGYAPLADGSVSFIVPEKMTVSLGVLVASMAGQNIFTIQKFALTCADLQFVDPVTPEGIESTLSNARKQQYSTFDLMGRKQGNTSLRPGIYVINGQKTIVK